jgi:phosphosulfolactate synthase (CoM biosynthesis protein A)
MRGPCYTPISKRCLEDIFETIGHHVDSRKFAGASVALLAHGVLKAIIDLVLSYDMTISTLGFIERVFTQAAEMVGRYLKSAAILVSIPSKSPAALVVTFKG